MTRFCTLVCTIATAVLATGAVSSAPAQRICSNQTGMHEGFFYTFWKSGGDACMILGPNGHYTSRYRLGVRDNLVLGKGLRTGSPNRIISYRAEQFEAGSNSYLALYGWSVDPLIEYYVVESWGADFTPPGEGAKLLGTVTSDGGTYNIYRTQRIQQPSIKGVATFYQYWSVRTAKRSLGRDNTLTFANHVDAWRQHDMTLGTMDYQVLATEGFGSSGGSAVTVGRIRRASVSPRPLRRGQGSNLPPITASDAAKIERQFTTVLVAPRSAW